jgi:hypothetical protein
MYTKFLSENLKERDHLKGPSIDDRIILKLSLRKKGARAWSEGLRRIKSSVSSYIHDNEPSGVIKFGEFLDLLNDYQLVKNNFDPRSWSFSYTNSKSRVVMW